MPLFTTENLINAVGGEEKLQDICIDKGANFLNGKITSTFDAIEKNTGNIIDNAGSIVADAQGLAMSAELAPEIIDGIVSECFSIISGEIESKMAEIVALPMKLALDRPRLIKEASQKEFDDNKITFDEAYKELKTSAESLSDEQQLVNNELAQQQKSNKIVQAISNIKNNVESATSNISKKISYISEYVSEGPAWITTQINNTLEENMQSIDDYVNMQKNSIIDGHKKFCETEGEKIGQNLAGKYNATIKKAAKKARDNIEINKTKASIDSFSTLQKAKLKIMAMTGVNIPMS